METLAPGAKMTVTNHGTLIFSLPGGGVFCDTGKKIVFDAGSEALAADYARKKWHLRKEEVRVMTKNQKSHDRMPERCASSESWTGAVNGSCLPKVAGKAKGEGGKDCQDVPDRRNCLSHTLFRLAYSVSPRPALRGPGASVCRGYLPLSSSSPA